MKIKSIFLSWDIILSIVISVLFYFNVPCLIDIVFAKDLYSIGISVLSIVFSVYFAALAIIISAGDNEFVKFLEEDENLYSELIFTFKFSLIILFIALIYSIILYIQTPFKISQDIKFQNRIFVVIFSFLFFYGLFASLNATLDSIKFAKYRTKFLLITKK